MSQVLTFGKHKSKTIEDVYNSDIGYCRWLMNQPNLVDDEVLSYLKGKLGNNDGSYVLTFGKYKGKTIKQVFAIDKRYIDWICQNPSFNE